MLREKSEQTWHEIMKKKERLASFTEIEQVSTPKAIKAILRPYQKEGLNWLCFLDEFNFGGCLADDMGLGKTLQMLTFLYIQKEKKQGCSLVVVPRSLMFNWQNEVKKFCPSLNVLIHHGNNRNENPDIKGKDLLITTYGTMMRDIEKLRKKTFNYIILDESQAIKNPAPKRYKAACLLKGKNRLAMTGTPVENHTFDLYAQFNFLNPGWLGSMKNFKDNYALLIDKEGDTKRCDELKKMIHPFLLRRTKKQVATDLPEKTEDFIFCEMDKEQRKVYDAYRNRMRDYVLGKIEEEGISKSGIYVLEGLTKLRQICNSPALISEEEDYGKASVKIDLLKETVLEKRAEHKVLIFSQFVKMLKLIGQEFDRLNTQYQYLDGSTTDREKAVNDFQENSECTVFLISLKAGGTGLNLTAADYVYLVDPWWNPAVENQAIDRCYRIGQEKHVFAYRMICKNTVEEKILEIQQRKRKLSSELIQAEKGFLKQLKKEDVKNLFA